MTYAAAGVDIDAGDALARDFAPLAARTKRAGSTGNLGGFGGLFDVRAAGYHDAVLIAGTDGVGTKLDIAAAVGRHDTIGIDLVAMCVNDVLAQAGEPLFFLDYVATSRLADAALRDVVKGISDGCMVAGCALIGGETAELPGLYSAGRYDLAGFCVGAVERNEVLPAHDLVNAGDVLIAVGSSGVHSNGFSLVRRIVEHAGLAWDAPAPWLSCAASPGGTSAGKSVGEALLTPTRIYVSSILPLMREGLITAAAHVTGGGLVDNPPRMLRAPFAPRIDWDSWAFPDVFRWLQDAGGVDEAEMRRTFNCGVGFVLCVPAHTADAVVRGLHNAGEEAWVCGDVVAQDI